MLLPFLILLEAGTLRAQTGFGHVFSAVTHAPLQGATVLVVGSTRGTVTDSQGAFALDVHTGEKVICHYVGFIPRIVPVGNTAALEIGLTPGVAAEDTFLAVAMGVIRQKAGLGYAVACVAGQDLSGTCGPNPVDTWVGKISGLVIGASNELLGAPRISLRGTVPALVVDGVPAGFDTWIINPEEIESCTLLKGPAAAALYGYRGINGVLLVCSKQGSERPGTGIEWRSDITLAKEFNTFPRLQHQYGPGDHGRYAYADGLGGGLYDGGYANWGPRFENQPVAQYDSPVLPDGTRERTPWVARGAQNLGRFLRPGLQVNSHIAVSTSTRNAWFRYSTDYAHTRGIFPNTSLDVAHIGLSAGAALPFHLHLDANLQYNRQCAGNLPGTAFGPGSALYDIAVCGGADWDINDLRRYWQDGKEGLAPFFVEYQRYNNPWLTTFEWRREHEKTDGFGQISLNWAPANGLTLTLRSAGAGFRINRSEKVPYSANNLDGSGRLGDYREDRRKLADCNTDLWLEFKRDAGKCIHLDALAGGNVRTVRYRSGFTSTNGLRIPGVYAFENSANPVLAYPFSTRMRTLAGYYAIDAGFGKAFFLSHSGRLDQFVIGATGKTVFAPMLSIAVVPSRLLHLGPVSFLKVRGALAKVHGGPVRRMIGPLPAEAYLPAYGTPYLTPYDGPYLPGLPAFPSAGENAGRSGVSEYLAMTVGPPASRISQEAGLELAGCNDRVRFDCTWFRYLDGLPAEETYFGTGLKLPTGTRIRTIGLEIGFSGTPVKSEKVAWEVQGQWGRFRRTFQFIPDGATGLHTGDRVDALYGQAFVRTADGQIVHDAAGLPMLNPVHQQLGYSDPDWSWSICHKIRYRFFSLEIQIDGRVGGDLVHEWQRQTMLSGRNSLTVEGALGEARYKDWLNQRQANTALPPEFGNYIGAGVTVSNGQFIQFDGSGRMLNYSDLQFGLNTVKTFVQDYVERYYQTAEANLISKTFGKLREVALHCQVPAVVCQHIRLLKSAGFSVYARNLWYFSGNRDIDLDSFLTGGESGLQWPGTRAFGFRLNLVF